MSTFEEGTAAYEEEDFDRAFEIMLPLAEAGDRDAQTVIGGMYYLGRGVERDPERAIEWYRLAAKQGQEIAQNNLANLLLDEDPEEAIEWMHVAAEKGLPFAESSLGDIYSGSINLPGLKRSVLNNVEAVKWYMRAGEQNYPIACHRLGDMYATGQGVEQDEAEALKWYEKAAEEDYSTSQRLLAQAYQEGRLGLTSDPEKAKYWLDRARANE